MLRKLFNLVFIIAIVLIIFHFLPENWKLALKDKSFAVLSKIIPESMKDKAASIIYTPTEQRAKSISQLEKNIGEIKGAFASRKQSQTATDDASNPDLIPESVTAEEVMKKLEESEKLINEVKSNNGEQGLMSKFTTAIIEKIIKQESSSTAICAPADN